MHPSSETQNIENDLVQPCPKLSDHSQKQTAAAGWNTFEWGNPRE